MTRDDAIRAFDGISNPSSFGTSAWIDRFVALGMLKLDEPPDQDKRLALAVGSAFSFDTEPHEMAVFRKHLAGHGLEIVDSRSPQEIEQ